MTNFSSGTCTILRIKNFSCPPPSTPNLIHLMYIAPLVCCHISFMFFRCPFLVATPLLYYRFVVGECTYMFEIMSDLVQCTMYLFKLHSPCCIHIYIYVWKLNQTVLELDLWADKFLFFHRRDLNSHHWYTAAPIA